MRLHDFLDRHRAALHAEWLNEIPAGDVEGRARFLDHGARLMDDLELALHAQPDPAKGPSLSLPEALAPSSIVRGLAALRAVVLRRWREAAPGDDDGYADAARLSAILDAALAGAVERHERDARASVDELRRNIEIRERFIGIVSHELREPLNVIAMAASVLQASGERSTITSRLQANVERMTRILADLLDFTRGQVAGGIEVMPAPVDLAATARRVIDDTEHTHPQRRFVFVEEGDARGEWDEVRLAQIVHNLVGNALRYGSPDGPIAIRVRGAKDDVELRVHNEGAPIPSDELPHVFDPFRRARRDHKSWRSGLGLGLSIVRAIVDAHGGSIRAESTAEHGTTFHVTLPRAPRRPPA